MKLLLVRFSSLGDLLYLIPVVNYLSEKNHDVHVLTYDEFLALFKEFSKATKIWTLKRGGNYEEINSLIKNLKKEDYSFCFDLHKKLLSLYISFKLKNFRWVRINKKSVKRRGFVFFRLPIRPIFIGEVFLEPFVKENFIKNPKEFYFSLKINTSKIFDFPHAVLSPEASQKNKEWPYFEELANELKKINIEPIVVGTKKRKDFAGFIDLRGKTDLKRLVEVVNGANLVISNDSALGHLGILLGKPTIMIFGPTSPKLYLGNHEFKNLTILRSELGCSPCSLHGERKCRFSEIPLCLSKITIKEVLNWAKKLSSP